MMWSFEPTGDLGERDREWFIGDLKRHQYVDVRCALCWPHKKRCSVAHVARIMLILGGIDPDKALLEGTSENPTVDSP